MVTSTEILAQQLAALRGRMDKLARTPQLPNSSIDNGAITVVSGGQPTAYVGVQYDGTSGAVVVAGPTPQYPNPPTVTTAIGGVKVHWDGTFAAPQTGFTSPVVAPLDFAAVDIHVSADPTFADDNVGFGTGRGSITSASGGDHFVSWPVSGQQVYARLITRTKPGKFSPPSQTTGPVPTGLVQLGDVGFPIAQYAGGTTIYYTVFPVTPTAPAWGFTAGDVWLEQTGTATGAFGGPPNGTPLYTTQRWTGSQWVLLQDQGISASLASAIAAQATADSKAAVFTQTTVPVWSGAAGSAIWVNTSPQGNGLHEVWDGGHFVPYQLGNGAIQPNSLIASNVIATGTVSAALLEATLVLASMVIAGDPNSTHAAMKPDGFHVFDMAANEVIRLGTTSNDYFGVVDSTGQLIAAIDDTGGANFADLNVLGDPIFQGQQLSTHLTQIPGGGGAGTTKPGARNWVGWDGTAVVSGVGAEDGLLEMAVTVETGRIYWIVPSLYWTASSTAAFLTLTVRDGGTSAPSTSSPIISQSFFSTGNNPGWTLLAEHHRAQRFTTAGQHRLLLTATGTGGTVNIVTTGAGQAPTLQVIDLGPDYGNPATMNRGGGGAAAPTQQYYFDLAPAATGTFRGNGSLRSDTTDIVQGWDPSGFNGDGSGWWTFNLPSITGTVDRVDWYVYTNSTYFNSGGQAIWRPIHSGPPNWPMSGLGTNSPTVVSPYPKPGGVQITLPSAWWGGFSNAASPRSIGIAAGPAADVGGGTNETYYCRFDGPSARLRIWFTQ